MRSTILSFVSVLVVLVQNLDSAVSKKDVNPSQKGVSLDAFLQSKLNRLEEIVSNKEHVSKKRFFTAANRNRKRERYTTKDPTLLQLNHVLAKFLKKNRVHKREAKDIKAFTMKPSVAPLSKRNDEDKNNKKQKWDEWTNWSSCSVSCGKGRHIRWRHCLDNCGEVETEMQERSCQLPACPQKLFGLLKL